MENLFPPLLWLAAVLAACTGLAVWWWRRQAQAERDARVEAGLDPEPLTAAQRKAMPVWQDTQPAARPSMFVEPPPVSRNERRTQPRTAQRTRTMRPFAQTGSPGL